MSRKMQRGKQQVLFNFLPNQTFDFEKISSIARVTEIRGDPRTDLNASILLQRIAEEVVVWHEDFRPVLRNDLLRRTDRFVLIDPHSVQAELFPKVLWCQNYACSRVFDMRNWNTLPTHCPSCRQEQLIQLRFVKAHRCGALQPLLPPYCQQCHTNADMALETRGSERIENFRWVCRKCQNSTGVFAGNCNECQWPDPALRRMEIRVHRAGGIYNSHTITLLNIPHRRLDSFFSLDEWPAIVAAKFLGLPEVSSRTLLDFAANTNIGGEQVEQNVGLSGDDLDELMRRQANGELTPEQLLIEMQVLRKRRQQEQQANAPSSIIQNLTQSTGVPYPIWQSVGREMLEVVMPLEMGRPTEIDSTSPVNETTRRMGIERLMLLSDYPIITAAYGFSRVSYLPNQCRLNPFPAHPDYGGRFPIFVDQIQADALLISLDYNRIIVWLERNGYRPNIPNGSDQNLARRAYFVQLFNDVSMRETLRAERGEARMVFGLLHTFSHLLVRQAALLCGLDRTSLSEYMLPRALTFAIYCNHRFGATIGALTTLFEQSLSEWLTTMQETRRCVYDPVCRESTGNCHACTHLAETSCRFFNLNLSRAFLFGGRDAELGEIRVGFFD